MKKEIDMNEESMREYKRRQARMLAEKLPERYSS